MAWLLWIALVGATWFSGVDDLKKKGVGKFERHAKAGVSSITLWAIIFAGYWIFFGSEQNDVDVASGKTPQHSTAWYEGGTLYDASALEWQHATWENKLATCAFIVDAAHNSGVLSARIESQISDVESMKPLALELAKGIDAAFVPEPDEKDNIKMFKNMKVDSTAVMIMMTMGWTE